MQPEELETEPQEENETSVVTLTQVESEVDELMV